MLARRECLPANRSHGRLPPTPALAKFRLMKRRDFNVIALSGRQPRFPAI
jgi:hypothetical protein